MSCDRVPRRKAHAKTRKWTVEVDLQDPLPVTAAELDAVERYFGDLAATAFAQASARIPRDIHKPTAQNIRISETETSLKAKVSGRIVETERRVGGRHEP